MKIPIAEIFETIQGEGRFAGTPSLFIRTGGCNLRCWWCLIGSTYIHTKRGKLHLKDVVVGDEVWSFNEKTNTQEYTRVVNIMSRSAQSTIKLMFTEKRAIHAGSIIGTPEHPVWAIGKGWIPMGQVQTNDVLLEIDISKWTSSRRKGNPHYKPSEQNKNANSVRMKTCNPMKNAAIAARVGIASRRRMNSPEWISKQFWNNPKFKAAVMHRMKTQNPMSNPQVSAKNANRPYGKDSSVERAITDLIQDRQLPIIRNKGKLNIGRRIPDFVVSGKPKVIEVTDPTYFKRKSNGYHEANKKHYGQHGYECLTIYLPAHQGRHKRAVAMEEVAKQLAEFAYNGRKVVKVVKSIPATVFNLTTENGTFFANNVLTHNCDTPYTSWQNEAKSADVADICDVVVRSRSPHVVITGGEPMLFPEQVADIVHAAGMADKAVTIETNGTLYDGRVVPELWSVSPKLASAAPGDGHPKERELHRKNSQYAVSMLEFAARQDQCQFKFVMSGEADVAEVQSRFVDEFGLEPRNVWAMPEGRTMQEVLERGRWLAEVCKARGWNLCLRQHVLLWGAKRGV